MNSPRFENNTFSGGKTTNLNATVGFNGSFAPKGEARSNSDYALGFSSAALELIKSAKGSSGYSTGPDFLVYPICFNMRHAVELWLKKWWKDLGEISTKRTVKLKKYRDEKLKEAPQLRGDLAPFPAIDEASTHNLFTIWSLIVEYAPIIDSRFKRVISLLDQPILNIADIDPTGQTFRYPAGNDSKVHLAETPLINIKILELRFNFLFKLFDFQERIIQSMKYEYSWVDTPNQLSYFDLQSISLILAGYEDKKGNPIAKQAKIDVMKKFELSSSSYSRAIAAIKCNSYLNYCLKLINEPKHLNVEAIGIIFNVYFEYKDLDKYKSDYKDPVHKHRIIVCKPSYEEIIRDHEKRAVLREKILSFLTREQIAEVTALLECYSEIKYMEIYNRVVEEHVVSVGRMAESELKRYINQNFFSPMMLEKLTLMLLQLNCTEVITPYIEKYGLHEVTWCKSFHDRDFPVCYAEYYDFESSIEQLQAESVNVLAQIRAERLAM